MSPRDYPAECVNLTREWAEYVGSHQRLGETIRQTEARVLRDTPTPCTCDCDVEWNEGVPHAVPMPCENHQEDE